MNLKAGDKKRFEMMNKRKYYSENEAFNLVLIKE
jgi:hypothetical protein